MARGEGGRPRQDDAPDQPGPAPSLAHAASRVGRPMPGRIHATPTIALDSATGTILTIRLLTVIGMTRSRLEGIRRESRIFGMEPVPIRTGRLKPPPPNYP